MDVVKVKSYAKLNLTLDITGAEGGYHLLDSLVCTVNVCDDIVAKKRKDNLINVYMHGKGSESIPPERNNAVKAGEKFVSTFGTKGADITIYKDIPMGAGMGGSSADVSGVLNAMAKLYDIQDEEKIKALADSLGSDTGYLLKGGFARMTGRGEKVEDLGTCEKLFFLLLLPKDGVSTPDCFRLYDELNAEKSSRTQAAINALKAGDLHALGSCIGNDLYEAGARLTPTVKTAMEEALSFSPLGAGMTGSGSGVFALFETEELCLWAKSRYKGKARAYVVWTVTPQEKKGWKNPFALSEEERKML